MGREMREGQDRGRGCVCVAWCVYVCSVYVVVFCMYVVCGLCVCVVGCLWCV